MYPRQYDFFNEYKYGISNSAENPFIKEKLIEQCKETAKLNLEICDDFKYVDGENI